jgi:hypothetical protein
MDYAMCKSIEECYIVKVIDKKYTITFYIKKSDILEIYNVLNSRRQITTYEIIEINIYHFNDNESDNKKFFIDSILGSTVINILKTLDQPPTPPRFIEIKYKIEDSNIIYLISNNYLNKLEKLFAINQLPIYKQLIIIIQYILIRLLYCIIIIIKNIYDIEKNSIFILINYVYLKLFNNILLESIHIITLNYNFKFLIYKKNFKFFDLCAFEYHLKSIKLNTLYVTYYKERNILLSSMFINNILGQSGTYLTRFYSISELDKLLRTVWDLEIKIIKKNSPLFNIMNQCIVDIYKREQYITDYNYAFRYNASLIKETQYKKINPKFSKKLKKERLLRHKLYVELMNERLHLYWETFQPFTGLSVLLPSKYKSEFCRNIEFHNSDNSDNSDNDI